MFLDIGHPVFGWFLYSYKNGANHLKTGQIYPVFMSYGSHLVLTIQKPDQCIAIT
jgi:hypothetical protein